MINKSDFELQGNDLLEFLDNNSYAIMENQKKIQDSRVQLVFNIEQDEEGMSRRILATHAAQPGSAGEPASAVVHAPMQPSLFDSLAAAGAEELAAELRALDLDALPPIEAWRLLRKVQQALGRS